MRYLGNKRRLLDAIEAFARERGAEGETLIDCFAGTATVAARFKARGYRVTGCDLLRASYTTQVALLEVSRRPGFQRLLRVPELRRQLESRGGREVQARRRDAGERGALVGALTLLEIAPPREGLMFRNYAPAGEHGRRYFRDDHARRIDAALEALRCWRQEGWVSRREMHWLLYAILAASDRVANIAGVYAAYLKRWQANTAGDWRLKAPRLVRGPLGRGVCGDAAALVARTPTDILYIDPPYNSRQYAAYYHVREVIAELPVVRDLAAYEARLYGKTGMRPYDDAKSEFCLKRKAAGVRRCEQAFRELIAKAQAKHIIVSYNQEGIISRGAIIDALASYAQVPTSRVEADHLALEVARFRSDANGRNGRKYKVLDGKGADRVDEWLFYAGASSHKS